MLKKVRISILSLRQESTVSLFEESKGKPSPSGEATAEPAAPERMEMMLEGSYRDDGERVTITYKESELSGMEGATTTLSYHKNNPGLVTMLRDGSVRTALVFEEGCRHFSVYQTAIMPFEVCIFTKKVCNGLENEGKLHLDYTVELRGAQAEENDFTLTLLPAFDRPKAQS